MRYFCGTPQDKCLGSFCKESGQSKHRLHASIIEAQRCFRKWVLSTGYRQDPLFKNRFVRDKNEPNKYLDRRIS